MLQDSKEKRTYDAIVIGSGASGGLGAKDSGVPELKTSFDRENVRHIEVILAASKAPWI